MVSEKYIWQFGINRFEKKLTLVQYQMRKCQQTILYLPNTHKPKMSSDQVSFIDIDFILYYVQHLTLALNFALRSIMTQYQMFQDV